MIDKNGQIITQIARSGVAVSMLVVLASCGGGQTTVQEVGRAKTMVEVFEAEAEALKAAPHAQPSDAGAQFPYQLDEAAKAAPFLVEAMWHDGRFTYFRTSAQKRLVLSHTIANVPRMIACTRTDDGLYFVRRVLTRDGWFIVGSEAAAWRIRTD